MALTEEIGEVLTLLEGGQIEVTQVTRILKDGVPLAKSYHNYVVLPGQSTTGKSTRVQAMAGLFHTPAVIAAFEAIIVANTPTLPGP